MGGNVEAYYEARAEAEARDKAARELLDAYGRKQLRDGQILLIERRAASPKFVVGTKEKTLLVTDQMHRYDVTELLKALGHKVRTVIVEAES